MSQSDLDLDLIVETAVVRGSLAAGVAPAVVASRTKLKALVATSAKGFKQGRSTGWMEHEDAFLRTNLGVLSEEEIALQLGRTPVAVHLRWKRDLHLPAPSKRPDVLTANQIAEGMGDDLHRVASWLDRGLIPSRRLPERDADHLRTRVVDRTIFLRWLVNPENWIYFKPDRVGGTPRRRAGEIYDAAFWDKARRLLDLARARWGDEWWTTPRVARYHRMNTSDVVRHIKLGRLSALQVVNLGGRHSNATWSYWFIRRSDAVKLEPKFGKGTGHELDWSPACDAFLILARAVGLSTNAIEAMLEWNSQTISYRLATLRRKGLIPSLIRQFNLKVEYDSRTGDLFADWHDYEHRFKRLASAMKRFCAGEELTLRERCYVRGVLERWATWYAGTAAERKFARSLTTVGRRKAAHFRELYKQMRAWADPLKPVR